MQNLSALHIGKELLKKRLQIELILKITAKTHDKKRDAIPKSLISGEGILKAVYSSVHLSLTVQSGFIKFPVKNIMNHIPFEGQYVT